MPRTPLYSSLLLVALALVACKDDSPTGPSGPNDTEAIEAIVTSIEQAWGAKDAATIAGIYSQADWVGPTGAIQTTPQAIQGVYNFLLNVSPLSGSSRHSTIRKLTFHSSTVAVLDLDTRVTGFAAAPPGTPIWEPGTIRVIEKNVLVKDATGWKIVQHQETTGAPGT